MPYRSITPGMPPVRDALLLSINAPELPQLLPIDREERNGARDAGLRLLTRRLLATYVPVALPRDAHGAQLGPLCFLTFSLTRPEGRLEIQNDVEHDAGDIHHSIGNLINRVA